MSLHQALRIRSESCGSSKWKMLDFLLSMTQFLKDPVKVDIWKGKKKIIRHLFNSKQYLYQTMLISNDEYIKQWLYRTMIISNNDYIKQWIAITTLKKVHWTLSYCRQVWKKRRWYVERSKRVFCKIFSKKMYLKYRCKDIIGKLLYHWNCVLHQS